jgi:DNA-binding NarL/FixJ family response regulator
MLAHALGYGLAARSGRMSSPPEKVQVVIVDDHDAVRRGIAMCLQLFDDLELAGEAGDGDEALDVIRDVQPDVVLMDIVMPRMDGMTATRLISEQWPQIRVIAFTSLKDETSLHDMVACGAVDVIFKDSLVDDLATTIRRVMTIR